MTTSNPEQPTRKPWSTAYVVSFGFRHNDPLATLVATDRTVLRRELLDDMLDWITNTCPHESNNDACDHDDWENTELDHDDCHHYVEETIVEPELLAEGTTTTCAKCWNDLVDYGITDYSAAQIADLLGYDREDPNYRRFKLQYFGLASGPTRYCSDWIDFWRALAHGECTSVPDYLPWESAYDRRAEVPRDY